MQAGVRQCIFPLCLWKEGEPDGSGSPLIVCVPGLERNAKAAQDHFDGDDRHDREED